MIAGLVANGANILMQYCFVYLLQMGPRLASWWRHLMETFSTLFGPLWGESTGDRWIPLTKASDAELWCSLWSAPGWINGWTNNRDADNFRRHHAHNDVTVMMMMEFQGLFSIFPSSIFYENAVAKVYISSLSEKNQDGWGLVHNGFRAH